MQNEQSLPNPPFSPVLFAGFLASPIPVRIFTPIASHILANIKELYPSIFDRLKPLGFCLFLITPTDFSHQFLVTLNNGDADVEILKPHTRPSVIDASISGPLLTLLALLEGRIDGDALFFSRELTVSGDTEAILTLRNAVDSVDINFENILSHKFKQLVPFLNLLLPKIITLFKRSQSDMDTIRRSLISPLNHRLSLQDADLDRQEERLKKMEKELRQLKAQVKRKSRGTEKD